jgi:hypothetical protein
MNRHSLVRIAISYGLDDRGVEEFESRYGQEFSLLHVLQTGSGADPASYTTGNESCFLTGKVARE